eukprot:5930374-Prymnesium_polylepis.1
MAFAQKVDALRRYLGVPTSLQMMPAVVLMNEMMGIIGEGPLPVQIEALLIATGIEAAAPGIEAAAPVSTVPAAPAAAAAPAPAAAVPAATGGKRKAAAAAAPPPNKKQQRTLFDVLPTAPKIKVPAGELQKQRELAAQDIDYTPEIDDVRVFKSERGEGSSVPAS